MYHQTVMNLFNFNSGVYKTTEIHFFYPPPTFENHFFYPYTRMLYKHSKANKKYSTANNALFTSKMLKNTMCIFIFYHFN